MNNKALLLVLVALLFTGFILIFATTATNKSDTSSSQYDSELSTFESSNSVNPSTVSAQEQKLVVEDVKVGEGREVKSGDTVVMNYTGYLQDGKKFDSSYDREQPFTTQIGAGVVIKGWDQGVPGMKIGGKRKLVIPPSLGYGAAGYPPVIPGNATLTFEVELLDIK